MKIEWMRRPQTDGSIASRSRINAAVYSPNGKSPCRSWELKSQYGHFFTHHGRWT